jgi:hypothetical protein
VHVLLLRNERSATFPIHRERRRSRRYPEPFYGWLKKSKSPKSVLSGRFSEKVIHRKGPSEKLST